MRWKFNNLKLRLSVWWNHHWRWIKKGITSLLYGLMKHCFTHGLSVIRKCTLQVGCEGQPHFSGFRDLQTDWDPRKAHWCHGQHTERGHTFWWIPWPVVDICCFLEAPPIPVSFTLIKTITVLTWGLCITEHQAVPNMISFNLHSTFTIL